MYLENEFKDYLINENETSESSVKAYFSDIKDFEKYINNHGKSCTECNADDIRAYFLEIKKQGKSASTINRKMVSVRRYFEFLRMNGKISKNPALKIKISKPEFHAPEYISIEQIVKLLEQPKDDVLGIRDKAILELLYACGLKASELAALNIQDIDLRIGFVSCRSERAKSRIIPMGSAAKKSLLTYMKDSRNKLLKSENESAALFLNYTGARISRQTIWKIVRDYGEQIELKDLSPVIIRNSFAAHMIKNGADLKSLQELLGNEDITMTKLYMSLSKPRLMDVYDRTHPRA